MKHKFIIYVAVLALLICSLANAEGTASEINGMYGENLSVDLSKDTFIPDSNICAYECEAAIFDMETMQSAFGDALSIDTEMNTATWSYLGGELSLSSDGRLYFAKGNADDYLNTVGYAKDANDMIMSSYIVNEAPLSTLSTEDAEEQILSMYQSIPWPQSCVEVKPTVELVPFNSDNIQNVYDITDENDWWLKSSHRDSVKSLLDNGVEFYYATVQFQIDDVPISMDGYTMTNERYINGCRMTFIVNADGIICMSMDDVYIPTQAVSDSSDVMTASEVLNKIGEFFDQIIMDKPMVITDMKFDYYPMASDSSNGYLLQPAWHVYLYDEDSDTGTWVAVNALTGEFLNL